MDGTEGLVRGEQCLDMGNPIKIPVGPGTLGRIINVIGEPIDERGPIDTTQYVELFYQFLPWTRKIILPDQWILIINAAFSNLECLSIVIIPNLIVYSLL